MVETFGTEKIGRAQIDELVREHFDLRPGAFREYLQPAPADLPEDRRLRPLRPRGRRLHVGEDRQGRRAARRGRARRGCRRRLTPTSRRGSSSGRSTAAHQVEGGNANNDWWAWEHAAGTPAVEPSGDAIDQYHRYAEDFALLAGLGPERAPAVARVVADRARAGRVQPRGARALPARARHARTSRGSRRSSRCTTSRNPRWFAERGGWAARDAVERFERYCERVARGARRPDAVGMHDQRAADRRARWATSRGMFPPGVAQPGAVEAGHAHVHRRPRRRRARARRRRAAIRRRASACSSPTSSPRARRRRLRGVRSRSCGTRWARSTSRTSRATSSASSTTRASASTPRCPGHGAPAPEGVAADPDGLGAQPRRPGPRDPPARRRAACPW